MLVDSSNPTAGSAVIGAIRQAAQATGTSFQYLLATAQVESGLNPQAGASTSSARGLFQFIEQTWLATMKQSGTSLGYGQYADAITKTASGKYEVQDPTMRSAILKLRNDPAANAAMAGAFTKENTTLLSQKLGRTPSEGELYIAHFLGVGGAAKLIDGGGRRSECLGREHVSERRARQFVDLLRPHDRRGAKPRAGAGRARPRVTTSPRASVRSARPMSPKRRTAPNDDDPR